MLYIFRFAFDLRDPKKKTGRFKAKQRGLF